MTSEDIKRLRAGEQLWDQDIKGFHVRAFNDQKAFYLFYRTQSGVQRKPKIGSVGSLTLSQAKEIAREWLMRVALGRDPSLEKKQSKKEATINQIFKACQKECWKDSDWSKEVTRLFYSEIEPCFGGSRMSEITASDIRGWHASYKKVPYTGNRALQVFSKLFSYAEEKEWRPQNVNPCRIVKPYKEEKRDRFATPKEIKLLGKILEREKDFHRREAAFIYLLIYTGARPKDIEKAKWSDLTFEGDYAVLKFYGKTGKEMVVVPPPALEIIKTLPKKHDDRILGIKVPRKFWERLRKEAGCEDLWIRDLRRTFATQGLSGGQEIGVISELLNHKSTQTTKIYARLNDSSRVKASLGIAAQIYDLLNHSNGSVSGSEDGD